MNFAERACELAANFRVFPLWPGSKLPAIRDFPHQATQDVDQIMKWAARNSAFNVGISTENLLAVDVDNKGKKKGWDELLALELEGKSLPETFEQRTPTGGGHFLYTVNEPVRQGTNTLGPGIDTRGKGGYVVGAGSVLETGIYTAIPREVHAAPDWLVSLCRKAKERDKLAGETLPSVEPKRAADRATRYLLKEAPLATEGQGGDQTTYQVAARVKDLGVEALVAFELMAEHWNPRCSPPWSDDALALKVENAYRYGSQPIGSAAPEAQFPLVLPETPTLHPFDEINREFARVIVGGKDHIIWETFDEGGSPIIEHWDIDTFHRELASRRMMFGGKEQSVSRLWMSDPRRRSYRGIYFSPGKELRKTAYNLWKGFAVEPFQKDVKPSAKAVSSLEAFIEHAHENICAKDDSLTRWLLGYFAHIVQCPWEKPLVALVLKGGKGVGKNALIERVGYLLGPHAALVSNRRHFTGNFNSHIENKILITLDEAFWSGDKMAEGVLKDLITGEKHLIERKGKEPYSVKSCLRVAILGNENWLVPASEDERRFAVFNVGGGRKQDDEFFQAMREGMESGGYRLLLRYLLDFDRTGLKANRAPKTQGLLEQKDQSLSPIHQWWKSCLHDGEILGSEISGSWPSELSKDRLRSALQRVWKERGIYSWFPTPEAISKELRKCCSSLLWAQKREDGNRVNVYRLPTLAHARAEWEKFIGHQVKWETQDDEEILL